MLYVCAVSLCVCLYLPYPWLNLFFCGKNEPFHPSPFLSSISLSHSSLCCILLSHIPHVKLFPRTLKLKLLCICLELGMVTGFWKGTSIWWWWFFVLSLGIFTFCLWNCAQHLELHAVNYLLNCYIACVHFTVKSVLIETFSYKSFCIDYGTFGLCCVKERGLSYYIKLEF